MATAWQRGLRSGAQGDAASTSTSTSLLSTLPSLPPPPTPPKQGTVFDYYVDEQNVCMAHWSQRVPAFTYAPDNFSSLFVPTVETTRLSYLLDLLVPNQHHVMFVGNTGGWVRDLQVQRI